MARVTPTRLLRLAALPLLLGIAWPTCGAAQSRDTGATTAPAPNPMTSMAVGEDARLEISLDGRVGLPVGYLKVAKGGDRGRRIDLDDLGIELSEALEASLAFHFTPRNAVRATFLYYFLEGSGKFGQPFPFGGDLFGPGNVEARADFQRYSLDYERVLSDRYGAFLIGTLGLTYVHLAPRLRSHGHSSTEDFSAQELPVPIAGLRVDIPLGPRWAARAALSGGGLPKVDSGRKDGGTVFLQQVHVDAGLSLIYAVTRTLSIEAGYHGTHFTQREDSRTKRNRFQLLDDALRLGVNLRF